MDNKFPVLPVAKEALALPAKYPLNILIALGLIVAAFAVGIGLFFLATAVIGISQAGLANIQTIMTGGETNSTDGLGVFSLSIFLFILLVAGMFAHIFNYWVRIAAFGKEHAAFDSFKQALSAAAVNAIKFLLIAIFVSIVSFVVTSVLSKVGLAASFQEQMTAGQTMDYAAQIRSSSISDIISTIVACLIYSIFSANLTQTAVQNDTEGLEHPYTMDFAIVLLLLYVVLLIPTLVFAYADLSVMVLATQFVLGFYIVFVIAAAHGLRYRICMTENDNTTETDTPPAAQ